MRGTQRRYYESLYEAARAVNSAHAPESVLMSIVENVNKALGAKGCSLMLLTPDKKQLLHTVTYGLSQWYMEKGPVSADKVLSDVLQGKVVAILDVTSDERVQYPEEARREGIASRLSVPMRLRGEVIGVVRVYTAEPHKFTKDEIYFVQAVANLGAIGLENARLYRACQKDFAALRQETLEWRAAQATSGTSKSLWFLRKSREGRRP